jgi:hypothetical protein
MKSINRGEERIEANSFGLFCAFHEYAIACRRADHEESRAPHADDINWGSALNEDGFQMFRIY